MRYLPLSLNDLLVPANLLAAVAGIRKALWSMRRNDRWPVYVPFESGNSFALGAVLLGSNIASHTACPLSLGTFVCPAIFFPFSNAPISLP